MEINGGRGESSTRPYSLLSTSSGPCIISTAPSIISVGPSISFGPTEMMGGGGSGHYYCPLHPLCWLLHLLWPLHHLCRPLHHPSSGPTKMMEVTVVVIIAVPCILSVYSSASSGPSIIRRS